MRVEWGYESGLGPTAGFPPTAPSAFFVGYGKGGPNPGQSEFTRTLKLFQNQLSLLVDLGTVSVASGYAREVCGGSRASAAAPPQRDCSSRPRSGRGRPSSNCMMFAICGWSRQRFKGVDMRWSEDGFNHLFHLRLAWVNASFDNLFLSSRSLNP
jgi:hypothetical protein